MNGNGQLGDRRPAFEELTGSLRVAFAEIRNEPVSEAGLQRVLVRARSIERLGVASRVRGGFASDPTQPQVEPEIAAPLAAERGSRGIPWGRLAAIGSRRIAWSGVCLAGCAALLTLAVFFGGPASANLAFAAIQEQVQKTRSVTYLETRLASAGIQQESRRVMILGRYLQREEVEEIWQGGRNLPAWIAISDLEKGKYVVVWPSEKRFVILTDQVTLSPEGGVKKEEQLTAQPEADLYQRIREIPADATTRLPERTVGNKQVVGFYYEETKGSSTWKRTFWVDPATRLPVQIEVSHRSTAPNTGPSDWVQSDFEFDNKLNKSLFSTDPPEGYTVETTKIYGTEIP
jgi:outer membrane lipoprotein-sorting protein